MSHSKGSIFGGALLVAGTAIGGGILGLPILTAIGGYVPSLVIYLLCWAFMTGTALLFVDIYLWSPTEVNIVSMAKMTLGKWGQAVAWLLYLYLFASLTVAYLAGGGEILATVFGLNETLGPLLFAILFAPFIWIGPWLVDRLNWFLMLALITLFAIFIGMGVSHIDGARLTNVNLTKAFLAMPVVFTSFGFQGLVPTLTTYLGRDRKATYKAIVIGSVVPLVVYIIWQTLILGIVPLGVIEQAKAVGSTAVSPLKDALATPWLYSIGQGFAFLTILTSFLGVSLALLDFLADGLKIKKTVATRFGLTLLIIVPPLIFATKNSCLFLNALQYGGGLGCALLLGLMPILMVFGGRRRFGSRIPVWLLTVMLIYILTVVILMFPK